MSNWNEDHRCAGGLTGAERLALGGRLTSIDGDPVVLPPDTTLSAAAKDGLVTAEILTAVLPPRPGLTWTAFSDAMPEPHRLLLVTNNLQARTAQGHMSHVWLVGMVHAHERAVEFLGRSVADAGEFTAFAHPSDMPLRSLSHWRYALPEEG